MKPSRLLVLRLMIGSSFTLPAFAGQLEDGKKTIDRGHIDVLPEPQRKSSVPFLNEAEHGDDLAQYILDCALTIEI